MAKKSPIVPPLFVNNKLIYYFKEKANIFNDFVVQPVANNSILPTSQIFYTQNRQS